MDPMNPRQLPWILICALAAGSSAHQSQGAEDPVDFARDVAPILASRCVQCHGPKKQEHGLRLDLRAAAFIGGDSGSPGVVAGDSAMSEIFHRITAPAGANRMPPKGASLSPDEIARIQRWIDEGAVWEDDGSVATEQPKPWSFQPIGDPTPPLTSNPWGTSPIDAYVLARLIQEGLEPAGEADKITLIRRLYLDLHGLLPTSAQVKEFVQDQRPDAWDHLVTEALASPRYGERWAQHWLDVVQYADTHGYEMNNPRPNAYPYRDYVIEALNQDKPYDQFIFEQLAGDTVGVDAATGFLVAGAWDQVESKQPAATALQRQDELTAMVNTTGTAFLGLTLGCARCHNHKFDPVPQRDFYALTAVFAGVRHGERPVNSPEHALAQSLQDEADARIHALRNELPGFRPAVQSGHNEELFAPILARSVRMSIQATGGGAEPCIDELEVWSGETNVALSATPTSSGNYPNNPKHKLAHINDGQVGNAHSWISDEQGKGWIQLDLAQPARIDSVVWARDRQLKIADRTPTNYTIAISNAADQWVIVSGSQDRLPFATEGGEAGTLSASQESLAHIARAEEQRRALEPTSRAMLYAGKLEQPGPTHRLHRGDATAKREVVAPDTLAALGSLNLPLETPEDERRIALARGIVDPENPLTARVMVNRVWHHHFGTGIVSTPGDFGTNGGSPSHPHLLDWLARQFIKDGWSIKALHRRILLSNTYRQASTPNPMGLARDVDTRLLWRFPPRRLEAEVIHDCILQLSGSLDLSMGGPGFSTFEPNQNYVRDYRPKVSLGPAEWRRMVYMQKVRMEQTPLFGSFDMPDAGQVCPKRSQSTTAIQALNLFNGRFVLDHAKRMATLLAELPDNPVENAYLSAYGRSPSADEASAAKSFIAEQSLAAFCRAIMNSNELVFLP
jgi:mono/diheme cytochrome c family protein